MIKLKTRNSLRKKRLPRIRKKIIGISDRPRMIFDKSNYALTVQLVDDVKHKTIFMLRNKGKNIQSAVFLAEMVIKKCNSKKVKAVVFDRAGYRYHGAVRRFVELLREGGIMI